MSALHAGDIAAAVAGQLPAAEVRAVQRLEGGVSAQVFRIDLRLADGTGKAVVLRAMGESGLESAQEHALLAALHAASVPVPRPIRFDANCSHINAAYVLMEFAEGSSEMPEGSAGSQIVRMAETLVTIHRTPSALLPPLPPYLDSVPELFGFLPDGAEWRTLRDFCASLSPCPFDGEPVLLHGDFWPRNLLWQDGRVVAVLDWEHAACGDPQSDVACTQLELKYLFDDELVDLFLSTCAGHFSIDPHRLALWQIYVASAGQHSMANWGLEPSREAHMRQIALEYIRASAVVLGVGALG